MIETPPDGGYRGEGPTLIALDFDGDAKPDDEALSFLCEVLEDRVTWKTCHRTARGFHMEFTLAKTYPPLAIVAIQALVGSDRRREIFNLLRALVLGSAPEFWRQSGRWNTLYAEKLGRTDPMIDPTKFGNGRPVLSPEDFDGADVAVLTILEAEEIEIQQDGEARPRLILTFEQFPDKAYWCNVTAVKTLVGKLGNNEAKWIGHSVPLVRATTKNPATKKEQEVMWVADGDKWEDLIAQNSGTRRPAKRGAAKKRR